MKMTTSLQKFSSASDSFINFQELFGYQKIQDTTLFRNHALYKLCGKNFPSFINFKEKHTVCPIAAILDKFSPSTDCRLHEIKDHPLYVSTKRNYSLNVPEYCSQYEIQSNPLLEGFIGAKFRYEKINYLVEPKNICDGQSISTAIIGVISSWYSFDRRDVV